MTDGGSQDRTDSVRASEAFLAMAVHELRAPLAAASGFALTLAEHLDRLSPDVVRDLLARIVHNHHRLDRLIDDLSALSALEAGQLRVDVEATELAPLLEAVVRSTDLGDHVLRLDVALDLPAVVVDPDRLEQVVANLLSNAVKFSPGGTTVTLTARAGAGATVAVRVTDEGSGIPPALGDRVFDAYVRDEATVVARPRGLGIGLHLARHLCQLMGAQIRADDTPGGGTTFTVTLPAREGP